jgi:transcriptional regulator with XRE-family HTH domain
MPWQSSTVIPSLLDEMAEQEERVAARLRQLREEYGDGRKPMSQEDAAHKAGVKARQWQRWEAAKHMPRRSNLEQVAEAFGIAPTAFYAMDDRPAERRSTTQLDRIETKLDQLLQQLGLRRDLADEPPADPDSALRTLEDLARSEPSEQQQDSRGTGAR